MAKLITPTFQLILKYLNYQHQSPFLSYFLPQCFKPGAKFQLAYFILLDIFYHFGFIKIEPTSLFIVSLF